MFQKIRIVLYKSDRRHYWEVFYDQVVWYFTLFTPQVSNKNSCVPIASLDVVYWAVRGEFWRSLIKLLLIFFDFYLSYFNKGFYLECNEEHWKKNNKIKSCSTSFVITDNRELYNLWINSKYKFSQCNYCFLKGKNNPSIWNHGLKETMILYALRK